MDGFGRIIYENGDCYLGQFDRGKKNGLGIYFWDNGDSYIGDFAQNGIGESGLFSCAANKEFLYFDPETKHAFNKNGE